ncbi:c-type cytochrome [Parapedobacter lycopersici]|uniref:c-type cytochrome n=1 Tax=Parapedobacter lycopersici TaxID=1864939 RepID=UPI00214D2FD5|nr:cytochrome c [Parapedobacter lycopersici]
MRRNGYVYLAFAALSLYLLLQSCQGEEAIRKAQYTANGQKLYTSHCQNCHGAKGEGLGALYPPLTDSSYLHEHRDQLACFIKHGLSGPIEVGGKAFDGEMPAMPQLTPIEIAYILTYIGNTFGNTEGFYSQEEVQQALKMCENTAR